MAEMKNLSKRDLKALQASVFVFNLVFSFLAIPFIFFALSSLLFFCLLRRNSEDHLAGSSPPSHYATRLRFYRGEFNGQYRYIYFDIDATAVQSNYMFDT